jgi:hypothetical protein
MKRKTPDHATLSRAAGVILTGRRMRGMLDLIAEWFMLARLLGSTLAIDSTHCDTHHRSRHYERRCRHYASSDKRSISAKRSKTARRTPKLSVGVDTRSHAILSAKARAGMGSDAPSFDDLLFDAWRRRRGHIDLVVADAGYDGEQPSPRAAGHGRALADQDRRGPPPEPLGSAAHRTLPAAHGLGAARIAEGPAVREAGAGGNGHEHAEEHGESGL